MASSLIKHKRINTTVAKAKALRKFIEPILTKAKSDTTHSRRVVFSYLQDKEVVTELFSTVAEKISTRPGGYTRIIKMGNRLGDNADMCMMELVDFNELMLQDAPAKKSRRSRRGGKKGAEATTETKVAAPVAEVVEEVATETATDEAPEVADDTSTDQTTEAGEGKEDK
jgi:large subunit ribosomal protein L17